MRRAYNVLENGKIVLANASAAEERELLGDPDINVWKYAASGYTTQGRSGKIHNPRCGKVGREKEQKETEKHST